MELRAFLELFIRRGNLIFGVVVVSLLVGFLTYRLQTQWYQGTVLLSVTRQGTEAATDYQYDQYYRLQADERMANTVARYLETAIGRRDTARRALLSGAREAEFIKGQVTALVLASNLVEVTYRAKTPTEAERIAGALSEAGERYIAGLNEQAGDRNWFTLVATEALLRDGRFTLPIALGIGGAAGLGVAFWTVLGLWYWRGQPRGR
ncbi:MAG: hypothetical protein IPJ68_03050 [Candidatus Moraniibacteriota bacterium]|nr:MAG: hypothetical protein IPJ68_03050 [Candidatus Moranbacteria bacterium]